MKNANPFTMTFGKEPNRLVSRISEHDEIMDAFDAANPASQVYILTGVRGAGKTVMMTSIARELGEKKEWIVININPERDILQQLAAKLHDHGGLREMFENARINLTAFGIGFSIENTPPISDIEGALDKMFKVISEKRKKVLITIDEVTCSEKMKEFAGAFQIIIRQNYPVFLLMTGLYDNIKNLQNVDSLTFLYRAPRIDLKPLSMVAMKNNYMDAFGISETEALEMASFTNGYSYAFQVLGYLKWETGESLTKITPAFDEYMEDKVYEKIWSELSEGDRKVMAAIAKKGKAKSKEIAELSGNTSGSYSTYRRRLLKRGLIDTSEYGYAKLSLPRFGEFVTSIIHGEI